MLQGCFFGSMFVIKFIVNSAFKVGQSWALYSVYSLEFLPNIVKFQRRKVFFQVCWHMLTEIGLPCFELVAIEILRERKATENKLFLQ